MMPETLYLLDGYASIFRAYYAIRRPLHSPVTGEPTQAILVFAQMLLKLFSLRPNYVLVALDAPGPTFRDELYAQYAAPDGWFQGEPLAAKGSGSEGGREEEAAPPNNEPVARYKGNRRATPDSLHQQIPRILELLDLFGIPVIGKSGLEADDVIATITGRVLADPLRPDLRVRIVSPDKDLEQLLSPRVTLFDVHTQKEVDVAALWEKRGVSPEKVVDLLALTGDVVDNIPGVTGIGPRTAAKLLHQFGSLDGILTNLDQIKNGWRINLERARPSLPLSRRLVTLAQDPDLAFSLDAARVGPLAVPDIVRLFDDLGFLRLKALLTRLDDPPPENKTPNQL